MNQKVTIFAFCFGVSILQAGCHSHKNSDTLPNNGLGGFPAICEVMNSAAGEVVCIDYNVASTTNESDCSNAEPITFAAEGAIDANYVSISGPGASTSCGLTNSSLTLVATCGLSEGDIRYYSNFWTASGAEANCLSLSGQFQDP